MSNDDDWKDHGLCKGKAELFFPEVGGTAREAKKICQGCPVRTECLQEAIDNNEAFGIWGGLSRDGRRALKRQQSRFERTAA